MELIQKSKFYFLDGSFCDWSSYGVCTSCVNGVGYQERSRNCSCPQPSNGGFDCTASGESNTTFTTFEGISMETKRLSCNNCSRSESIQNIVNLRKYQGTLF